MSKPFANPLKRPSFGRTDGQLLHATTDPPSYLPCHPSPLKLETEHQTPDELRRARDRQIEDHFGSKRYVKLLRAGGEPRKHPRSHSVSADHALNKIAARLTHDSSVQVAPFPNHKQNSHKNRSSQQSTCHEQSSIGSKSSNHKIHEVDFPSSTTIPSCGTDISSVRASSSSGRATFHEPASYFRHKAKPNLHSLCCDAVENIRFSNRPSGTKQRLSLQVNHTKYDDAESYQWSGNSRTRSIPIDHLESMEQPSVELQKPPRSQPRTVERGGSFSPCAGNNSGLGATLPRPNLKMEHSVSKQLDMSNTAWQQIERKASLICGEKALDGLLFLDQNTADDLPAHIFVLSRCRVGVNGRLERTQGLWLEEQLSTAINGILLRLEVSRRRQAVLESENYRLRKQLQKFINLQSESVFQRQSTRKNDNNRFEVEEIACIENTLRNAKSGLRTILNHQRIQVEATHAAYKEAEQQLQRLMETSTANDEDLLKAETKVSQLRKDLAIQTEPPNAAMIIQISRVQQLKRGLNIYHNMRMQRILNILIFECLLDSRERSRCGYKTLQGEECALQPSKDLLDKCSPSEQQMVEHVVRALKEYGFDESFKFLPMHPSEDHGVGWVQPPTWLLDFTKSLLNKSQHDPKFLTVFGDQGSRKEWECLDWTYASVALPPNANDL